MKLTEYRYTSPS